MGDVDLMSPPSMSESATRAVSISTQIMVATVVVLFFVVAFCFFLHLYVKCYWAYNNEDPNMVSWRRQLARQRPASSIPAHRRGLDTGTLQLLPVVVYDPKEFKDGLECAVCLSEVSEGEKARLLPKCNHGFHVECIDMWFQSHSTCPLCRNPVIPTPDYTDTNLEVLDDDGSYTSDSDSDDRFYDSSNATEVAVFPTNVLFWGNETHVSNFGQAVNAAASSSASSSGASRPRNDEMVIDIPSHELCVDCSSSPQPSQEMKTPVMSRLRSLGRLLSMGKRVAPTTCDVDQQQV